jgi:hypothetical protein
MPTDEAAYARAIVERDKAIAGRDRAIAERADATIAERAIALKFLQDMGGAFNNGDVVGAATHLLTLRAMVPPRRERRARSAGSEPRY